MERREEAFAKGKKFFFLVCPLCGRGKPIKTVEKAGGMFRVKPEFAMIQARYALGGRGRGGFFMKEDENLMLNDMKIKFPNVFRNLKEEIRKLYDLFYKE